MENRSLVTIAEHSKEKILYMLEMAKQFEMNPNRRLLQGKVVATLFFEPSTRTRLSFETAANRLGARVIGFTDPKATSSSKGETLKDTIMMVSSYADIIVMRHYLEGAARYASEVAPVPIVNAGDGANQHPSQTMLDLYSIYKTQGTLENLNIFLVGDLKYGRTVHSLLMAMRHFNPTFHFIAPEELKMPEEYKLYCKTHQIKYVEHTDFSEEIIADADILYMTRVQRERFADPLEYEKVKNVYILRNAMLANAKENMRILHPLPRVNEIDVDVDENPKAYYTELTDVIRIYIKERFGFNAMEMTSAEIIERLLEEKDKESIHDLKVMFETADLVKFAKYAPLMNENDMNLVNAVDFINQTKIEEDPNAKKEPTEIKVEEKRSKQGRIALLCSIAITGVAALIALYLSVRHIIDLFF